MKKTLSTLFIGLIAVAAALCWRLPRLDAKPMHGDEANQAVRAGILMDEGEYHYDPTDHHGPALYFAALPFCRATAKTFAETTEWNFRLVPVTFSVITLLLMLGLQNRREGPLFLNPVGLLAALLFTACSPAMVYYSRFFIQETMLVTFLTGMLLCGLRWSESENAKSRYGWAAGLGAFAGLAAASKETVVLSFAASALAGLAAFGWRRIREHLGWRDLAWVAAAAALTGILLFSSFGTHFRGVYDALFSTVSAYLHRATAVPEHQHPWHFYLTTLFYFRYGRGPVWGEWFFIAPALCAFALSFWRGSGFPERWLLTVRFIGFYTIALTVIYSCIPYKTPWCGLSFLHGYLMLAAVTVGLFARAAARIFCHGRRAWGTAIMLFTVGWAAHWVYSQCRQSYRACFQYAADPRNPYVYAHTGTDAMNLVAAIETAAKRAQGADTPIAVAAPPSDIWPLPWYLRAYRNVGYWNRIEEVPAEFNPVVVVAAADQGDLAESRFGKGKQCNFYGIRPGTLLNLFIPE